MVKKKTTRKKSASVGRTRTVYVGRSARRSRKSDASYIPSGMATAGLILANATPLKKELSRIQNQGLINATKNFMKNDYKDFIKTDLLIADAMYLGGGYILGSVIQKYAPNVIKKPIGKLSKKMPRVI